MASSFNTGPSHEVSSNSACNDIPHSGVVRRHHETQSITGIQWVDPWRDTSSHQTQLPPDQLQDGMDTLATQKTSGSSSLSVGDSSTPAPPPNIAPGGRNPYIGKVQLHSQADPPPFLLVDHIEPALSGYFTFSPYIAPEQTSHRRLPLPRPQSRGPTQELDQHFVLLLPIYYR